MTLTELSSLTQAEFSRELGAIFEHSPWIADNGIRDALVEWALSLVAASMMPSP